jgi:hypothetical protein
LFHFGGDVKLVQGLRFAFFELEEERALFHEFEDEVDVVGVVVVEEAVETQDVFVVAVVLDFYLLDELVDEVVFLYYFLADALEGEEAFGLFVDGHVDLSEFALAQGFLKLEVVEGGFAEGFGLGIVGFGFGGGDGGGAVVVVLEGGVAAVVEMVVVGACVVVVDIVVGF